MRTSWQERDLEPLHSRRPLLGLPVAAFTAGRRWRACVRAAASLVVVTAVTVAPAPAAAQETAAETRETAEEESGETDSSETSPPALAPSPAARAKLGPLLAARVADAADDPKERLDVVIYVDTRERIAEIVSFLAKWEKRPRRTWAGGAGDVYGGAVSVALTLAELVEIAELPGVRYIRKQVPARIPRRSPASRPPPPKGPDW